MTQNELNRLWQIAYWKKRDVTLASKNAWGEEKWQWASDPVKLDMVEQWLAALGKPPSLAQWEAWDGSVFYKFMKG